MTNVDQIKNHPSEVEKLKAAYLLAKQIANWMEKYKLPSAEHNFLKKHD